MLGWNEEEEEEEEEDDDDDPGPESKIRSRSSKRIYISIRILISKLTPRKYYSFYLIFIWTFVSDLGHFRLPGVATTCILSTSVSDLAHLLVVATTYIGHESVIDFGTFVPMKLGLPPTAVWH
jgi:hypothetical protein